MDTRLFAAQEAPKEKKKKRKTRKQKELEKKTKAWIALDEDEDKPKKEESTDTDDADDLSEDEQEELERAAKDAEVMAFDWTPNLFLTNEKRLFPQKDQTQILKVLTENLAEISSWPFFLK